MYTANNCDCPKVEIPCVELSHGKGREESGSDPVPGDDGGAGGNMCVISEKSELECDGYESGKTTRISRGKGFGSLRLR